MMYGSKKIIIALFALLLLPAIAYSQEELYSTGIEPAQGGTGGGGDCSITNIRLGGGIGDAWIGPVNNLDGTYRTCFYAEGSNIPYPSGGFYQLELNGNPQVVELETKDGSAGVACTTDLSPSEGLMDVYFAAAEGCSALEVDLYDSRDLCNILPTKEQEAACLEDNIPDDAVFTVNKDFTDGNPAGVDVTLDCFQGLPITQTQTVSEAQNVEFTVQSFEQGTLDCNLSEAGTSGYTASYDDGDGVSAVNCSWQDLSGGSYQCYITNTPDPVEVIVSKDWVIDGEGGDILDSGYSLTLYCETEIVGGYNNSDRSHRSYYKRYNNNSGTSDIDYLAEVIPDWDGGTDCFVEESHYDSAVESSTNCDALHINIVEDETDVRSCTVTNQVFFEGIPSLSQYGLVILALLMLSVGLVGFRRFG